MNIKQETSQANEKIDNRKDGAGVEQITQTSREINTNKDNEEHQLATRQQVWKSILNFASNAADEIVFRKFVKQKV